ncbi:esterase FE4 [Leptinotarsa decemlineata]|uniref:esterase FE4 n=1 Tax=Leptinotarsa decemlineata TaxID=7539 RepID=UPI003D30C81C
MSEDSLLTTKDGVFPANISLKDQNLALKWIQRNIIYFGGDPSKVTLVGHSSGAVSVGFHVISEKSKGLLSGAILQSSSPIAHFGITVDARHNAFAVGKALDPNLSFTNSSTDLLRLLKTFPAEKIMRAEIEVPPHLTGESLPYNIPINWTMTIEDPKEKNPFLIGPFHDDVKDGNINKVPILIGITDEELIGVDLTQEMAAYVDNNITCIVNTRANIKEENKLAFATELRDIYTKVPFQQNMTAFYTFNSDFITANAVIRHADLHSKHADTYFYQFSYKGHLNGLLKPLKRPPDETYDLLDNIPSDGGSEAGDMSEEELDMTSQIAGDLEEIIEETMIEEFSDKEFNNNEDIRDYNSDSSEDNLPLATIL